MWSVKTWGWSWHLLLITNFKAFGVYVQMVLVKWTQVPFFDFCSAWPGRICILAMFCHLPDLLKTPDPDQHRWAWATCWLHWRTIGAAAHCGRDVIVHSFRNIPPCVFHSFSWFDWTSLCFGASEKLKWKDFSKMFTYYFVVLHNASFCVVDLDLTCSLWWLVTTQTSCPTRELWMDVLVRGCWSTSGRTVYSNSSWGWNIGR